MKYIYQFNLKALDSSQCLPDRVNYIFYCPDYEIAANKAIEHAAEYEEQYRCSVTSIILKECAKL